MGKCKNQLSWDDLTAEGKPNPAGFCRLIGLSFLLLSLLLAAACNGGPPISPTAVSDTPQPDPIETMVPATLTPTATITPRPTSALAVEARDLDGITLTLWHPWSGETGAAIQASLTEFNSHNEFGITVEAISQGSLNSLYEMIADEQQAAGLPNITLGANYQIQSWISSGKPVNELNQYLNDPDWGFSPQELADFYDIFLEQDIRAAKRFGMPAVRTSQVIFYNTSWAEELGFESPPETPEQFREQACAAAEDAQNQDDVHGGSGGWLINTTPSAVLSWLYAFNSSVLLPDEAGYQFNSPETGEALAYLKALFDQGCAYEVLESPPESEFANRRALMITSSLSDLGYQQAEFERLENSDRWTVIGFPSSQGTPRISVYGPSYAIFAGTPAENLAAWLTIKWLLSPEQGAKLTAAHGTFPVRSSTEEILEDYANEHPQWAAAQKLLPYARAEPGLESWGSVRWILADVGTQVFRYYFTPERIPATMELMDETAAELHTLID